MTNLSSDESVPNFREEPSPKPLSPKLTLPVKLAYGAGDLGAGLTSQFLAFFLLSFLLYVAGMDPLAAGLVLAVGKVWDAVNDPLVGMLSDRTKTRWGRRYPWIFLTAIPFGLTYFLIWITPFGNDAADGVKFWYYVVVTTIFQIFFTTTNLPYTSLTAEMSRDYDESTELTSFRLAFSVLGGVAILVIAGIVTALIPGDAFAARSTRYLVLGLIGGGISVASIYWCVFGTYGYMKQKVAAEGRSLNDTTDENPEPFLQQLKSVLSNRPFLFVVCIYLFSWLSLQITAAVLPFYAVSWMGVSESLPALLVQGPAIALMFVCAALSKRLGKKRLYYLGSAIWIPVQAALYFLQPGQSALLFGLCFIASFGVAVAYVVPWSILPDVIDLDELKTGRRREGTFYSFMTLLQKLGLALGLFLVGAALKASGFIRVLPEQPLPEQPASALHTIRLFMGPVPLLFVLCALVLVYFYPLTREAHAEIMLKLAERKRMAQTDTV
ncbi:MAG: MFS transporter [Cyanobacteria bacterium P01_D01_bin.105]